MNEFMKMLLSLSVSGTLIFMILKAVKPLYKEKFSRRWQYYIWLIAALRFLIPFAPETALMNQSFIMIENSVQNFVKDRQSIERAASTGTEGNEKDPLWLLTGQNFLKNKADSELTNGLPEQRADAEKVWEGTGNEFSVADRVWMALFLIWAVVFATCFALRIRTYHRFVKCLAREDCQVCDGEVRELMDLCADSLHLKRRIRLYSSSLITSPLLLGVRKPALILPAGEIPREMLPYVFRHELMHCRRRDNLYKWLVQIVVCVHWFNPLVYCFEKEVGHACELACDEAVVAPLDVKEKRKYGDMLIAFARAGNEYRRPCVCAELSEGGKQLKERLKAVITFENKRKTVQPAAFAVTLAFAFGAVFLGSYTVKGQEPEKTEVADVFTQEESHGNAAIREEEPDEKGGALEKAHLELVHMEEAYPWILLEFQIVEANGEVRLFEEPAPPDVILEQGGTERRGYWSYLRIPDDPALEKQNQSDGFAVSFWSTGETSATITAEGLSYTAELPTEEPKVKNVNQERPFLNENAVIDKAMVYTKGFSLHLSGIDMQTRSSTMFILAEKGTEYKDYLEGYVGDQHYDEHAETLTLSFAFPEGIPDDKELVLRVIENTQDETGERDYQDYTFRL